MSFGKAKKQNNKIHIGSRAFDVFLIVFMIIVAIIFLYPFLNVIATSLSSNRMITTGQVTSTLDNADKYMMELHPTVCHTCEPRYKGRKY